MSAWEGLTPRRDAEWALRDLVVEAMQDAWDDFVADTGCYPDCLTVTRGPTVTADFGRSNFALGVAQRLHAALAALTPPPLGTEKESHWCRTCGGEGCEYGCGRCEKKYAGPNSHRFCGNCGGTGVAAIEEAS